MPLMYQIKKVQRASIPKSPTAVSGSGFLGNQRSKPREGIIPLLNLARAEWAGGIKNLHTVCPANFDALTRHGALAPLDGELGINRANKSA